MATEVFELSLDFRGKRYQDAQKGLEAFADHLGENLERVAPVLKRELRKYLDAVVEAMELIHGNPWPKGTTDLTMARRSGATLKVIKKSVKVSGTHINDIEGRIGGPFYLNVHEYGATIRAKKAKYLTIPLPAALYPNGVPRKQSARQWDNTFVKKSRKGNLLIFQKRGANIVPLYVLKRQVVIPPRLKMRETIVSHIPFFQDSVLEGMLRELTK